MKSSQKDESALLDSPVSSASSSRASSDLVVQHGRHEQSQTSTTPAGNVDGTATPQQDAHAKRFVRFDVDGQDDYLASDNVNDSSRMAGENRWTYDEDFSNSSDDDEFAELGTGGRAPLLTGMAAPSVVVAGMDIGDLEGSGTRSGMKMAFMNMANSIM
ncbi:hypothetical protein ABW19_dt0203000 [Dactylella cylindrospora]|nr:hypothetical protein ABW19_dt0203000 [Dactylella cylindrospora]